MERSQKNCDYSWYYFRNKFLDGEHSLFDVMLKKSRPDVVIDIGAHWGVLAAHLSNSAEYPNKIICVEPDPENFGNLEHTLSRVTKFSTFAVNAAIADVDGSISSTKNNGACLQTYDAEGSSLKVRSFRLKTILNNYKIDINSITHIKIDVDGYEPQIIDQIIELSLAPGSQILIEFWPEGLRRNNYDPENWIETLTNHFIIKEQNVLNGHADKYEKGIVNRLKNNKAHLTNLILEVK